MMYPSTLQMMCAMLISVIFYSVVVWLTGGLVATEGSDIIPS